MFQSDNSSSALPINGSSEPASISPLDPVVLEETGTTSLNSVDLERVDAVPTVTQVDLTDAAVASRMTDVSEISAPTDQAAPSPSVVETLESTHTTEVSAESKSTLVHSKNHIFVDITLSATPFPDQDPRVMHAQLMAESILHHYYEIVSNEKRKAGCIKVVHAFDTDGALEAFSTLVKTQFQKPLEGDPVTWVRYDQVDRANTDTHLWFIEKVDATTALAQPLTDPSCSLEQRAAIIEAALSIRPIDHDIPKVDLSQYIDAQINLHAMLKPAVGNFIQSLDYLHSKAQSSTEAGFTTQALKDAFTDAHDETDPSVKGKKLMAIAATLKQSLITLVECENNHNVHSTREAVSSTPRTDFLAANESKTGDQPNPFIFHEDVLDRAQKDTDRDPSTVAVIFSNGKCIGGYFADPCINPQEESLARNTSMVFKPKYLQVIFLACAYEQHPDFASDAQFQAVLNALNREPSSIALQMTPSSTNQKPVLSIPATPQETKKIMSTARISPLISTCLSVDPQNAPSTDMMITPYFNLKRPIDEHSQPIQFMHSALRYMDTFSDISELYLRLFDLDGENFGLAELSRYTTVLESLFTQQIDAAKRAGAKVFITAAHGAGAFSHLLLCVMEALKRARQKYQGTIDVVFAIKPDDHNPTSLFGRLFESYFDLGYMSLEAIKSCYPALFDVKNDGVGTFANVGIKGYYSYNEKNQLKCDFDQNAGRAFMSRCQELGSRALRTALRDIGDELACRLFQFWREPGQEEAFESMLIQADMDTLLACLPEVTDEDIFEFQEYKKRSVFFGSNDTHVAMLQNYLFEGNEVPKRDSQKYYPPGHRLSEAYLRGIREYIFKYPTDQQGEVYNKLCKIKTLSELRNAINSGTLTLKKASVPAPVSDLKTEVSQILGESVHKKIKAEWLNLIKSGFATLSFLRELHPDERIAMLSILNPYFELPAPSDKTHENAHTSEESKATEVSTASGTPSSQPASCGQVDAAGAAPMNGGALNNATIQAPRRTALAALPAFQALGEEAREKALDAFTQRSALTGVSVEDLGKQLQDDPATLSFLLENF